MEELLILLNDIKPGINFSTEKNLVEDFLLDSFDIVQIVTAVSEKYGVNIPVSKIIPDNFSSAEKIFNLICELHGE